MACPATPLPTIIAHCDWGKAPNKRWMTWASRHQGDCYLADGPDKIADARALIPDLVERSDFETSILLGFDFPIGLPEGFSRRAGICSFLDFLLVLDSDEWCDFCRVADRKEDICHRRPFYPRTAGKKGEKKQEHLLSGLGVKYMNDLLRRCEGAGAHVGAACPVFWTLGAKQVGRAAIHGWQQVIVPELRHHRDRLRIWPFDGDLEELVQPGQVVIVETYPAAFYYPLLGVEPNAVKKRQQLDRQKHAKPLLDKAHELHVILTHDLAAHLGNGFGPKADGEDHFDAFIGLLGMMMALRGGLPSSAPDDELVRRWEGWILGRPDDY